MKFEFRDGFPLDSVWYRSADCGVVHGESLEQVGVGALVAVEGVGLGVDLDTGLISVGSREGHTKFFALCSDNHAEVEDHLTSKNKAGKGLEG